MSRKCIHVLRRCPIAHAEAGIELVLKFIEVSKVNSRISTPGSSAKKTRLPFHHVSIAEHRFKEMVNENEWHTDKI